jgi:hypothetical protein
LKYKDYRFSVAPMMDWTGTSQKAKHYQHLNAIVVIQVIPNEVPANLDQGSGDKLPPV